MREGKTPHREPGSSSVSVIIPTLEEESSVREAILSVKGEADEVIVVDGGSHDETRAVAAAAGARVLVGPPGRGTQLDLGARAASGDWLVFLHADTRLEAGWAVRVRSLEAGVVGGAFRFAVDSPRRIYRCLEAGVALRCRLVALPYGDQALFVRRGLYASIGGFPPQPLMEDVSFARRLKRAGPVALLPVKASTSPRRWERLGVPAATLWNWYLLALYALGGSPETLARLYHRAGAQAARPAPRARRLGAAAALLVLGLGVAPWSGRPLALGAVEILVSRGFPDVPTVSGEELARWLQDPGRPRPVIVDVRTSAEYRVSHLPGAVRAADEPGGLAGLERLPRGTPLVLYCSVGFRSALVARRLRAQGFSSVFNLGGSVFRWANEGRPLVGDLGTTALVHPYNALWGRLLEAPHRAPVALEGAGVTIP